uniref:Purine nucleoside phosphorylase n=1 Tax=Desulfovibrio sp. U5L TaxID=596152 RepID=I2Q5Z0_9BACT
MHYPEDVKRAAAAVTEALGPLPAGAVGLVSGTGLGGIAEKLENRRDMATSAIPGFPAATAPGHAGRLVYGTMGTACPPGDPQGGIGGTKPAAGGGPDGSSRPVALLSGRLHLYEGHSPRDVAFGVRLLAALGVRRLILTNAAGALNPHFTAGGLMRVTDHLNLTGRNPLVGPNDDALGPRFPDMSRAYSPRLGAVADACALSLGLRLERGVYAGVLGPSLETPAETRMLRLLGADAVGMSTVTEVIAARHLGLEVLAVSCLTNVNLPDCMAETTLEAVLATAKRAEGDLARLLAAVIPAV